MKKLNGLYSKQVYWPDGIQYVIDHVMSQEYTVICSYHANQRIEELHLPGKVYKAMLYGEIIEAEFDNGRLVKIVTRLQDRFFENRHVCAAIRFGFNAEGIACAKVVTVWVNEATDNHITINSRNYVRE